ncbi:hypothetical protein BDZ91DRAFT_790742 [Kalaharituber pfeilii]|nr:hypothetical protein BDZ91DRAFT_790742 [Kalaharituber pfeilii]
MPEDLARTGTKSPYAWILLYIPTILPGVTGSSTFWYNGLQDGIPVFLLYGRAPENLSHITTACSAWKKRIPGGLEDLKTPPKTKGKEEGEEGDLLTEILTWAGQD